MRTFITAQANQGDPSDAAFEELERAIGNLKEQMDGLPDRLAEALEPLAGLIAMREKDAGVTINTRKPTHDEWAGYSLNDLIDGK